MHELRPVDPGRVVDWGRTSSDYSDWRPDYPAEFYRRLAVLGVGLGQRILDLGTGVGFLATNFAAQGCNVAAVDIAAEQVGEGRRRAARMGLQVDFRVASAEATGYGDGSFDVITASQCWLYFDRERTIAEVQCLLRPEVV